MSDNVVSAQSAADVVQATAVQAKLAADTAQAAVDSANWAYYALWIYGVSAVIAGIAAILTLYAVIVARRGLSSWKDQHISTAKAEWIASLVNYASGLSYLPEKVNWRNQYDKDYIDKIAGLLYECIKHWKVLQVYLEHNENLKKEVLNKYSCGWVALSVTYHNLYMNGSIERDELKSVCVDLYNT